MTMPPCPSLSITSLALPTCTEVPVGLKSVRHRDGQGKKISVPGQFLPVTPPLKNKERTGKKRSQPPPKKRKKVQCLLEVLCA